MANPSRLEKIQITGNTNSGTATKVNVQEANGEVNTQAINTAFNKNFGLNSGDVVGANTLLNQYSTIPVDWTATTFSSGQVVFYGGKQWIAKMATVAGDVPSVSSKWEEITFEALANKSVIVDATPTDGSNNAVSSNGVFDALDTKAPISSVHNPVTLGTANGLSLSNQQLSLGLASSGVTGALSGTDWNNFNNKQPALGFTPENLTNKQNSLAVDGTGTKYPTVDAVNSEFLLKQNNLNWKTPQDYGAIGDGIADDTAAIQACFLANKNVLLYGTYKISDYIELFDDQFVFSNNATITRNTSLATSMLAAIDRFGIQIKGALTLVGGGNSVGLAAGISFVGCDNVQIDGVVFKDISGTALNLENSAGTTLPRGDGCLVSNIQFFNCYIGLNVEAFAEYHSFININATACNTGLVIKGGNISITSGSISDNVNGVYLGGSFTTNNSHGVLNGLQINHNTLNLKIKNAEFGETIQGCHFYGDVTNNIEIINSKGLIFSNCTIDGKVFNSDSITPNGSHLFTDCLIEPSTSFVGSNMLIKNCITRTGGAYIDNNYDAKGINHPVGTSWNDFGNINIYSNDAFAIDKGGSLSLGGVYNSTGGIASFAKIHGKAETSTTGSLDGYMAFEVSNNSIAPYSREVGRFSSLGDFSVLRNISATSYTGSATLTGTPTAPTAPAGTNTNQIATTAFVQGVARPYKVYTALLTQTGTNAPTATVLENTLGGTVVWSRLSAGHYNGTLVSAFPYLHTATFAGGNVGNYTVSTLISYVGTDGIRVATSNGADGILNQTSIEIRVYL